MEIRYGLWTVIGQAEKKDYLLCKCQCGTEREVSRFSLERGVSQSCGCAVAEKVAAAKRKISREDEARVVDEYNGGKSLRDLAAMFGVSTRPIQRILKEHGVEARPARRPQTIIPDEQAQELRVRYDNGMSTRELARLYGYPHDAVRVALERTGGVRRQKRGAAGFTPEERMDVVKRWNAGESQLQLAADLDVSPQTIDRILTAEGIPAEKRQRGGNRHWAWKGGETVNGDGYVSVLVARDDPIGQAMQTANGRVLKHRLVMAHYLGRALLPNEEPHHKNGVRTDNRIENLELMSLSHPRGQRAKDLLAWAREIIELYGPAEDKL